MVTDVTNQSSNQRLTKWGQVVSRLL